MPSDEGVRPTLLFVPGELHLFRAVGSYHAWELAKGFDIVMLVAEHYRNDVFFQRLLALIPIRHVAYFPMKGKIWRRHRRLIAILREVATRFAPTVVYQHAYVYPHNLYAYFLSAEVSARVCNVVFQTALSVPDLTGLAANLAAGEAMRFAQRYRIPSICARAAYRLHHQFWCLLSYRILPLLFIGRAVPEPYNMLACHARVRSRFSPNAYLVYTEFDAANFAREYGRVDIFRVVQNPLLEPGESLDRALYQVGLPKDRIVILPSQDWVNDEIGAAREDRKIIIARYSRIWSAAIARLTLRFPGYSLLWKPHPAHRTDEVMLDIISQVRMDFPDLAVEDGSHSAEVLMLESRVVVSDVSNVLWWASLHRGLVAISLDLWNGKGGQALRGRPGIHYINALDQIDALSLLDRQKPVANTAPTVLEAVKFIAAAG